MHRAPAVCLVAIMVWLSACARPLPMPPDSPRPIVSENKMGVHLLLDDGRNHWPIEIWRDHLIYAQQAVGEWGYVTQVIETDNLDVEKWQHFMDLCAELHLTPILRLATTFEKDENFWAKPPTDARGRYTGIASDYVQFITALDWPTDQRFVIVGNEPNHGNEWGGAPNPAEYARFLIDVANAIHAADSDARVLNAAFDPYAPNTNGQPALDGFQYMDEATFLDAMVATKPDVFRYIDAWASHPYALGAFIEPPWVQSGPLLQPGSPIPPVGIVAQGVNAYDWELWKLSTFGIDALPVMITETGWRHVETTDPAATDSHNATLDAETIATYFDLAYNGNGGRYPDLPNGGWTPWLQDDRVIAVTPFAFNGYPAEWGHTNWLMLDSSGEILGTYPMFDLFVIDNMPSQE